MQEISCHGRKLGKWEPAPRHCILIPGLPKELALIVLARVPLSFHGGLRSVCRAWRYALDLHICSIRKALHISEEWVILLSGDSTVIFFDPLFQSFSKPLRLPRYNLARYIDIFGTSGNLFALREAGVSRNSFRFFDKPNMLCQGKPYYFPQMIRWMYTAWVVVNDHIYVVGDECSNSRGVKKFNVTTQTWDLLPNMHVGRTRPAVMPLQGRLFVIGGHNHATGKSIYSGEIWDAEKQEWILEPELWPQEIFDDVMPVATTVMGTIYALQPAKKEFLCYDPRAKLWTSLGAIPWADYPCKRCGGAKDPYCLRFIGVRNELWMMWECCWSPDFQYGILACVPTLQAQSRSWRAVPITKEINNVRVVYV